MLKARRDIQYIDLSHDISVVIYRPLDKNESQQHFPNRAASVILSALYVRSESRAQAAPSYPERTSTGKKGGVIVFS